MTFGADMLPPGCPGAASRSFCRVGCRCGADEVRRPRAAQRAPQNQRRGALEGSKADRQAREMSDVLES